MKILFGRYHRFILLNNIIFFLEYTKGLRIFVLRSRNSESYNDTPRMAHLGDSVIQSALPSLAEGDRAYYSLIKLPNQRLDALACAALRPPWLLSLWVREEMSHCLSIRGVELINKDALVGILGCRGRSHRPLMKPILFIISTSPHLEVGTRGWDACEHLCGLVITADSAID
jgi:hypothetical protein